MKNRRGFCRACCELRVLRKGYCSKCYASISKSIKRCLVCIIAVLLLVGSAFAVEDINVEKLADAINRAENSTKYPYGIKSINTHGDEVYARRICINTIKNNIKRYEASDKSVDYITFLGNRYCPPTAHSLNRHWVKNVKHFYYKSLK